MTYPNKFDPRKFNYIKISLILNIHFEMHTVTNTNKKATKPSKKTQHTFLKLIPA